LTQIFDFFKKFDIGEACQVSYHEEILNCESLEEITEVVEDMFVTLMSHISTLMKESQDLSDLSRSKQIKNIQETINCYEKEIRNTAKVSSASS